MSRAAVLAGVVSCVLAYHPLALGRAAPQEGAKLKKEQDPQKEIEQLKKEIELLKKEIELLKRENALLKKGDGDKKGDEEKTDDKGGYKVTVDDVVYEYGGAVREGARLRVTVFATSKKGNQLAPTGVMRITDDEGDIYTGRLVAGPQQGLGGSMPGLREGIRTKLIWEFGGGFGKVSAAPPAKLKKFAAIAVERGNGFGGGRDPIEFKGVPVQLGK